MFRILWIAILSSMMGFCGCAGLIGQRFGDCESCDSGGHSAMFQPGSLVQRGPLLDRPVLQRPVLQRPMIGGVVQADYVDEGCSDCGVGHGGTGYLGGQRVRHSCQNGDCDSGCDRCQGGTMNPPLGSIRGMPWTERFKSRFVCGDGCGEVYIGEWISTPPTADPCDTCGNFTGNCNHKMYRPHRQPVRNTLRGIGGIRFGACQGCGGGDCDGGCGSDLDHSPAMDYGYLPQRSIGGHAHGADCGCGG